MTSALKKVINRIGYFLLFSHIWLGICASMFTLGSYVLLRETVQTEYLVFTFFGTVCIYTIHRYYNHKYLPDSEQLASRIGIPVSSVQPVLLGLISVSGLGALISYFYLQPLARWILLSPILISVLYVIPTVNNKRLKDFPLVKIFAIALSWTFVSLIGPMCNINIRWDNPGHWFLISEHLLFLFAMAIPFDIRDEIIDNEMNIKTIPTLIGVNNSQYLGLFCLFAAAACFKAASQELQIPGITQESLLVVYMVLGFLIIQSKKYQSELFYLLLLDGILLLYGGIIWINTCI